MILFELWRRIDKITINIEFVWYIIEYFILKIGISPLLFLNVLVEPLIWAVVQKSLTTAVSDVEFELFRFLHAKKKDFFDFFNCIHCK